MTGSEAFLYCCHDCEVSVSIQTAKFDGLPPLLPKVFCPDCGERMVVVPS